MFVRRSSQFQVENVCFMAVLPSSPHWCEINPWFVALSVFIFPVGNTMNFSFSRLLTVLSNKYSPFTLSLSILIFFLHLVYITSSSSYCNCFPYFLEVEFFTGVNTSAILRFHTFICLPITIEEWEACIVRQEQPWPKTGRRKKHMSKYNGKMGKIDSARIELREESNCENSTVKDIMSWA